MKYPFLKLQLILSKGIIQKIFDTKTNEFIRSFGRPLTSNTYKLYIIKEKRDFLYVGISKQPLRNRFRSGLKATGKHGYHGYKWKEKEKIDLFIFLFEILEKEEIENIEAELVYLIRQQTGNWPLTQNEIHFNNNFPEGKKISRAILKSLIT